MLPTLLLLLVLAPRTGAEHADKPTVLVTGATGQTGSLVYHQAKKDDRIGAVRALVRDVDKARRMLNCTSCDESEGIYVGDVTAPSSLTRAFDGVDALAIAVGVGFRANASVQKAVEFTGVESQVAALAGSGGAAVGSKRVVLCSSMGTTDPHPAPFEGGPILFWKLNAEAMLGASGVPSTVVKPCGIEGTYGRGGKELVVGHDDALPMTHGAISRADLAAVMLEALVAKATGLRFDLCVGPGKPTTDLKALLDAARWPWEQ
jgi:uncharacterized protein YbjT (DUF2867 family)